DRLVNLGRHYQSSHFNKLDTRLLPSGNPILESVQHMTPISVRRPMVAVVKKNNVSGTYFFEAPAHIRRWLRLPVAPVYGPHHDFRESSALRGLEELWTTEAIGWPDALCTFPGCLENRVITAVQFVHNLL